MPPERDPQSRLWQALSSLHRRLSRLEAYYQGGSATSIPTVSNLPPAGIRGRILLRNDGTGWLDLGTVWKQFM